MELKRTKLSESKILKSEILMATIHYRLIANLDFPLSQTEIEQIF